MKKFLLYGLCLILSLSLLMGCNRVTEPPAADDEPTESTVTEPLPPTTEGKTPKFYLNAPYSTLGQEDTLTTPIYPVWTLASEVDSSAEATKTIQINGQEITCEYKSSGTTYPNYYVSHEYEGPNGETVRIDSRDGKLIGYYLPYDPQSSVSDVEITPEQAEKLATDFINQFYSTEGYVVKVEESAVTSRPAYQVSFQKHVGSWLSCDYFYCLISKSGLIRIYYANMANQIPTDTVIDLDKEQIKEGVLQSLQEARAERDARLFSVEYDCSVSAFTLDANGNILINGAVTIREVESLDGTENNTAHSSRRYTYVIEYS